MSRPLGALLQHLVPKTLLSAFIYRLARCRMSLIAAPLIRWFAKQYGVDLGEAERSRLSDYESFNDFFTRALRPGARPIDSDPGALVSPADGTLTQFGRLTAGRLLQAKGMSYALADLLGEQGAAAEPFVDGEFATIYLAPHNYHRVHAPLAGHWIRTRYIPGARFSVNAATSGAIRDLFCRNERLVCWFQGGAGAFVVVLVGALNVSSMSTATRGEIASGQTREWHEDAAPSFAKGAEIGRFNLGSTVILLLPQGSLRWRANLEAGQALSMGAAIATLSA